jgi:hypothetical protein
MLEEDRIAVCGPRYAHQLGRQGVRGGTVGSESCWGAGRSRFGGPRVRADGHEVILPTFQAFADTDPLNRRVVEQILVGGSPPASMAAAWSRPGRTSVLWRFAATCAAYDSFWGEPASRNDGPFGRTDIYIACHFDAN